VFWVIHDSYATSGAQLLLGHSSNKDFYTGGNQFWGLGNASEAVKCGITETNGVVVDGTLTDRPKVPAIVSLVTTANEKANQLSQSQGAAGSSWEGKMAEAVGNYLATKYRLSTSYPSAPSDSGVIINAGVTEITTSSAVLNGVLDAHDGAYAVYAYWGAADGGTNPVAWATSRYVGSCTNANTNVSCSLSGLLAGHAYYYTFMASNATGRAWATPSWLFRTAGQTAATCMLTVRSAHGTAVPAGVTEQLSNSVVNVSIIDSPVINGNNRYVCAGWVGTGNVTNGSGTNMSFTITRDSSINWVWSTNLIVIPVPVVSTEAGGVPASQTSAVLRGVLSSGETARAWFCWGTSDGGTGTISAWQNVLAIGTVNEGVAFSNLVTGLSSNTTYYYRCYTTNAYGSDWSDTAEMFSGWSFSAGGSALLGGAYFEWDAAVDTPGDTNWVSTTTNTYNWIFDSGPLSPIPVSDPRFVTLTKAYAFPAAQDTNSASFKNLGNTSSATFEFVFDADADNGLIFESGGTTGIQFDLYNGVLRGYIKSSSVVYMVSNSLTATDKDRFIHAAFVVKTNSTFELYLDGQLKQSVPFAAADWSGTDGSGLGNTGSTAPNGNKVDFTGKLALFRYYRNKALSAAEVQGNFKALCGGVIFNQAPADVTDTAATFKAALDTTGTNYAVRVYYGSSNGGTNASAWATNVLVGSWSDVITNISYTAGSLTQGQTYFYTFCASNASGRVWARPSWTFRTQGIAPSMTVNHAVPHAWLSSLNANWSTNYEAAALSDPDGDGFMTWQEYWSGTDPQDANSCLKIDAIEMSGNNLILKWRHASVDVGIPPIVIQARSNLVSGSWVGIGTHAPSNGVNTWSAGSSIQGFYRLAVTNAP
jgi:hypothetical protein